MGTFSSTFFSALLGIIGCAKLLQAIARLCFRSAFWFFRDNLLGILRPFAQGTAVDDEPTVAVVVTYILTQITLFSNINQIASFVTMTFLLTFMVVNLACFLLKYHPQWFSLFQDLKRAKLSTKFPLFSVVYRIYRCHRLLHHNVFRWWCLCYSRSSVHVFPFSPNTLPLSAEGLGRCYAVPYLSSSQKISSPSRYTKRHVPIRIH